MNIRQLRNVIERKIEYNINPIPPSAQFGKHHIFRTLFAVFKSDYMAPLVEKRVARVESYETHHAQTASVEIGLFLHFPWLPYIIGFLAILIVVVVFLFFYLRIQKKKKEIHDEEESIITSRKSSGMDMHTTLPITTAASDALSHQCHIVSYRESINRPSAPVSIPSRSRAYSSSHHPYFSKGHPSYVKPQNICNHLEMHKDDLARSF